MALRAYPAVRADARRRGHHDRQAVLERVGGGSASACRIASTAPTSAGSSAWATWTTASCGRPTSTPTACLGAVSAPRTVVRPRRPQMGAQPDGGPDPAAHDRAARSASEAGTGNRWARRHLSRRHSGLYSSSSVRGDPDDVGGGRRRARRTTRRHRPCRRYRPDGGRQRGTPADRSAALVVGGIRVPELRSWTIDRSAGTLRIGAAVTYAELAAPPWPASAGPGPGGYRRFAADPQRGDDRGQRRHLFTGGRRPAGARGIGGHGRVGQWRRSARAADREVMVGVKQTALRWRAGDGDHRAVARRLAGLRQGRRAQCDGHRHRRGVPGGRRAVPIGAPRSASVAPTIVRAEAARRTLARRSTGRKGTIAADAVAEFGRLAATASAPIGRPPLDGGRRRTRSTYWPVGCCDGVHRTSPNGCRHERASLRASEPASRRRTYTLHVNGVDREVAGEWLGESLLYVLRERLGLYGAKGACEQGECGSCTVLVDGVGVLVPGLWRPAPSAYRSSPSRASPVPTSNRRMSSGHSSMPALCSVGSALRGW